MIEWMLEYWYVVDAVLVGFCIVIYIMRKRI